MNFDFMGIKNEINNRNALPNTLTVKPNISEGSVFLSNESIDRYSGAPEYRAPDNRTFDSLFNMIHDAYYQNSEDSGINLSNDDYLEIIYATMKDPENREITGMTNNQIETLGNLYREGDMENFLQYIYDTSDSLENLQLYDIEFEVE